MRARSKIATYVVSTLIIIQSLWCTTLQAGRHAFEVGDKMPEFSATTLSGQVFTFKHNKGKTLMVVFLSPRQKHSARAAADVEMIIRQLGTNAERLETVIVVDDSNSVDFQTKQNDPVKNINILLDLEYKLWGKFGIIAIPTVVISDTNDKVICVKAGHGYDFVPMVRAYVNQALGLAQKTAPVDAGRVETVADDTTTTFVMYSSDTFQGTIDGQPGGNSKLCLSCHDGANPDFAWMNPDHTFGTDDLVNSHPISFVYDSALAALDGALKDPSEASTLGGTIMEDLLDPESKVQCASCHDVHTSGVGDSLLRGYDYGSQHGPELCRMFHLK